jgi:hypothetical protein
MISFFMEGTFATKLFGEVLPGLHLKIVKLDRMVRGDLDSATYLRRHAGGGECCVGTRGVDDLVDTEFVVVVGSRRIGGRADSLCGDDDRGGSEERDGGLRPAEETAPGEYVAIAAGGHGLFSWIWFA